MMLARAEVLQGGHGMESTLSSKCAAISGSDNEQGPVRDGIGVDGQRGYQQVR